MAKPRLIMNALDQLKRDPKWVAWKYEQRGKSEKPTKPPINPHTGRKAKINDPSHWSSYDEAVARKQRDKLAGVGYVLTDDDDLTGADLDDVRDPQTGEVQGWVMDILELGESYAEVSPSGKGIRIFWRGKVEKATTNKKKNVEIYGDGRYLTITGDHIEGTPLDIRPAPKTYAALLARAEPDPEEKKEKEDETELTEWHVINSKALKELSLWVTPLFGSAARRHVNGTWRVSSKDLGRDLQEDLSISPEGIVDFGIADMGDPRHGKRTPIRLVEDYRKCTFNEAVAWLCDKIGHERPPILLDPKDPVASAREMKWKTLTLDDGTSTFHRHLGFSWQYDPEAGKYIQLNDEQVHSLIRKFLETAVRKEKQGKKIKVVPFKPMSSNVREIADAATTVFEVSAKITLPAWIGTEEMPPAHEFLACGNGLLHLPTSQLFFKTASFFNTVATDVKYSEEAPEPVKWLAFLDQTIVDTDGIEALQEWMGYTLTVDTRQQKILMCLGPRRSGKGTVDKVLTRLLGEGSVTGFSIKDFGETFGIQHLISKSLAVAADVRVDRWINRASAIEKLLSISGEDEIAINRKNLGAWFGRLPTRLMILTNEAPRLSDASAALASRFLVIKFKRSFLGQEDMDLASKLMEELPGILNWAIEGYKRLQKRGRFVQPEAGKEVVQTIEALSAPITAFVEDRCEIGEGLEVSTDLLWDEWVAWSTGNNSHPGTKINFVRSLRSAFESIEIIQRREGGKRPKIFLGLGLNQEEDPL